jgi:hypothetical protein
MSVGGQPERRGAMLVAYDEIPKARRRPRTEGGIPLEPPRPPLAGEALKKTA